MTPICFCEHRIKYLEMTNTPDTPQRCDMPPIVYRSYLLCPLIGFYWGRAISAVCLWRPYCTVSVNKATV
jgi:hypothetical protein